MYKLPKKPEYVGFTRQDEAGMVYFERPEQFGFREVGQVEPEFRIYDGPFAKSGRGRPTGWLTDPYGDVFKDGTGLCWGVVYQIVGKKKQARFVPGYQFGGCDGGPTLDLSDIYCASTQAHWDLHDAAREAARRADQLAKDHAEQEREYQTAWRAGSNYDVLGEEIVNARREALELLMEMRGERKSEGKERPAICAALRAQVQSLLGDIKRARAKRAKLAAGDHDDLYFYAGDKRLQEAFCEGASLSAFPR